MDRTHRDNRRAFVLQSTRSPIIVGESGATVFRVIREDGVRWIEKIGPASDVSIEAAAMEWRAGRLPVAEVFRVEAGVLSMSELRGVNVTDTTIDCAVVATAEALQLIHSVPTDGALALRSMGNNFGSEAEQSLRKHVPRCCDHDAFIRSVSVARRAVLRRWAD